MSSVLKSAIIVIFVLLALATAAIGITARLLWFGMRAGWEIGGDAIDWLADD